MLERKVYMVEGLSKPLPIKYNVCMCLVNVTSERFLKMLGTSNLELLYREETESIEFRFLSKDKSSGTCYEEGLAKLNRIANKQRYNSFMNIEKFVTAHLNVDHYILDWQVGAG